MKRSFFAVLLLVAFYRLAFGQAGGKASFEFLNIPPTARIAALGGAIPVVKDQDLSLLPANAALISNIADNGLLLNFTNYYAGVKSGYGGYVQKNRRLGNILCGINYMNYGKFTSTEPNGDIIGSFSASEYALNFGFSKKIDSSFTLGSNVKTVYSFIEKYNSLGLAMDLSAMYHIPKLNLGVAFLIKNLGYAFNNYTQSHVNFPLNIQFVATKKLMHAPLQFTMMANNLQKLNLSYTNPSEPTVNPITGEALPKKNNFFDSMMRHFIFGAEILPGKNLQLRLGYNYLTRVDLSPESRSGISGFSFGLGIKISKFSINYSHSTYHIAGGINQISISRSFNTL